MNNNNLRVTVSFRNTDIDFKIYAYLQAKRDKSSYVKDLIEKEMLKEENKKDHLSEER